MAKVGQDIFQAKGIDRSLFCAQCCYNLKTRPIIGRCPECGSSYDARGSCRRGILEDQIIHWPVGDFFLTLITAAISAVMIVVAIMKSAYWYLVWGVPMLLMACMLARGTYLKTRQSVRTIRLLRQAARSEDDAD